QEASQEHGFDMKFRKLKKPNYGAHIERLFGTFAERIHELDGTTFSNTVEKGDYKSEKNATMTLVEFERWFANLILGEYHHDVHSTLGVPPIERYREGLFGSDKFPGLGM
ncbi:transposase, partial [Pseudomonas aeruginosa]|nr:transposase [Pseudomonas aeruginosa]